MKFRILAPVAAVAMLIGAPAFAATTAPAPSKSAQKTARHTAKPKAVKHIAPAKK
jgi:hypothetical protein